MDKAYCELSLINNSEINELNREQPPEEKYLERPLAYEFYHQVRKLIDRGNVNLGEKTVIQTEVDKTYQNYFETGKIPEYAIEVIIGNEKSLGSARKTIKKLSKTEGEEIIIIWFNVDSWQASLGKFNF